MEPGQVVRVIQKFVPHTEEELLLNIGDIVQVHRQIDRYWVYGCSRGVYGNLPKDCIVAVEKYEIPVFLEGDELFVALDNFAAQETGDLRFGKGEFIVGIEPVDSNWWRGRCNEREGIFPLTLVWQLQSNLMKRYDPVKKVRLMAKVLMDLHAQLPEEMDLRKGETITVTEIIDKDWYRGERNGKSGIFPSGFVKLMESNTEEERTSAPDLLSFQYNQGTSAPNTLQDTSTLPTYSQDNAVLGYGRVSFDFNAQYENELSVQEGDIVKLIQRIDAQWVEVENEGRTGLIPSCYLDACENNPHVAPENESSSALALYDFNPQFPEDVSLKRGERVSIMKKMNSDWLLVMNSSGKTGLCPCNYVTKSPLSFHGSSVPEEERRLSLPETSQPSQEHLNSSEQPAKAGLDDTIAKNLAALDSSSFSLYRKTCSVQSEVEVATTNTQDLTGAISSPKNSPTLASRFSHSPPKLASRSMSEVGQTRPRIIRKAIENRPCSYQSATRSDPLKVTDNGSHSRIPHRPAPAVPVCGVLQVQPSVVSRYSSSDEAKSLSRTSSISTVRSSSSDTSTVSINLPKQNVDNTEKRRLIILELVQTEKDYLSHMRFCYNVFFEDHTISRHPDVELEKLLAHLDEVLAAGQKLQRLFDEELKLPEDEQIIGKCFQLVKEELKIAYGNYCRNQDEVQNLLEKYEENVEIQIFFKNKMESPGAPRNYFNLGAVLIAPVQRILKYPLLLNELIKATPESHQDKSHLLLGLTAMTDVAVACNECKRRKDLVKKYRQETDSSLSSIISKISLHSVAKKSQRIGMRISSTLGITSGTRDHVFDEDELKFRDIDRAVKLLHKNTQNFTDQLQEYVMSQFHLSEDIANYYMEKKMQQDVEKYRTVQLEIANYILTDFKSMIERRVIDPLDALLKAFTGPNHLIDKRHDKLLDYDSANQRVLRNKDPVKTKLLRDELQIARNDYDALNTQLLEELPKLTTASSLILSDCLKAFIYARRRFIGRVAKEIFPLMELPLLMSSSGNILDSFHIKHNLAVDLFQGITCVTASTHSAGLTRSSSSAENYPREKERRSGGGQKAPSPMQGNSPLLRPKLQTNLYEQKTEQSSSQRAFIQSKFKRDMLYVATKSYEPMALLDISMHIGDIVGVIKMQDPMGTSDRWFIDNGAIHGFVPSKYLAPLHSDADRSQTPSSDSYYLSRTPSPCLVPTQVSPSQEERPKTPSSYKVHRYDEVPCQPDEEKFEGTATRSHRYDVVTESPSPVQEPIAEFYYALYEYGATGPNTLSLAKGQVVLVLHTEDLDGNPEWWYVQDRYGHQGYAPANYLAKRDTG